MLTLALLGPVCFAQDTDEVQSVEKSEVKEWKSSSSFISNLQAQREVATDSKKLWSTNALIIIKDDTIIFEEYFNGFKVDQKQRLWSISKSVTSALVGIAIKKKVVNLFDRASKSFPELKGKVEKTITIENLLTMSSGLKWNEGYEKTPFNSHVINMLYLEGQKDMATFTAKRQSSYRPGRVFNYSSGETNLVMGILKKSFANQDLYNDFVQVELFKKIGITNVTWEQDNAQTFVGSSYLYLSPRDLARFAKLILNKGKWEDQQIIPENYVSKSLSPSLPSCMTKSRPNEKKFSYGYFWWLNAPCKEISETKAFPKLPNSLVLALGHHGQTLALFPEQNAIAIRLGADKLEAFDRELWLEAVYRGLKTVPKISHQKEAL